MKKPYLLGLMISLLVGVATVAIKSSITRYPGLGDFFLFYGVAEGLVHTGIGERVDVSGEVIVTERRRYSPSPFLACPTSLH